MGILEPLIIYYHEIEYKFTASTIVYRFWLIVWALARINLYVVYIYRLHSIFKKSTFKRSKCVYIVIAVGCAISMASMVFVMIWQDNSFLDGASDQDFILTMISELVFLVMDIVIIISLMILFISPFMELVRMANQHHQDEMEITDIETETAATPVTPSTNSKKSFSLRKVSMSEMGEIKQLKLLQTTTKIALLVLVSLFSSFLYQFIWVISLSSEHGNDFFYTFPYTWGVDDAVNIICLYFSYNFAQRNYERVCMDCIRLHSCFLFCIARSN